MYLEDDFSNLTYLIPNHQVTAINNPITKLCLKENKFKTYSVDDVYNEK